MYGPIPGAPAIGPLAKQRGIGLAPTWMSLVFLEKNPHSRLVVGSPPAGG